MNYFRNYEDYCASRGLVAPAGLTQFLGTEAAYRLGRLLYWPNAADGEIASLSWALDLLADAAQPPPSNLLPLLPVDDTSIACVICATNDEDDYEDVGQVVRWHLNEILPKFQGALLDNNVLYYLRSIDDELADRQIGLSAIKELADEYKDKYSGKKPHGWVTRPVQLACQNVIVGLSAFQHDSTFDGLRVPVFLTCEVPHLATHEANRAMSALMLCDAFQNGGTMEIRFGENSREHRVPPALRRFGRSLDLKLGAEDPFAITPAEARELFLAVTPMPDELWARTIELMDRGVTSPERLCFTLLTPVWRAIELDYLLASSSRAVGILEGGSPPEFRRARLAELEASRAALMTGMFFRRLENHDKADRLKDPAGIAEDDRLAVDWSVSGDNAVVNFFGVPSGNIPWADSRRKPATLADNGLLVVLPRALPIPADLQLARDIQEAAPDSIVVLLVPNDMAEAIPSEVPLLICPDRLSELDIEIERRLQRSRISRS